MLEELPHPLKNQSLCGKSEESLWIVKYLYEILLAGRPYVLIVFCLFVIFIFTSRFGFNSGIWLLIAPVPVRCFSITYIVYILSNHLS